VSSSWANDKAMQCLDYWWECAKLYCNKSNFLEVKFDSVIVEVKVFNVVDSSSGADLFLNVLLNRGNVCEPEVIRAAE
jgi:hypothetical protein